MEHQANRVVHSLPLAERLVPTLVSNDPDPRADGSLSASSKAVRSLTSQSADIRIPPGFFAVIETLMRETVN